jgi:hypothetical protein
MRVARLRVVSHRAELAASKRRSNGTGTGLRAAGTTAVGGTVLGAGRPGRPPTDFAVRGTSMAVAGFRGRFVGRANTFGLDHRSGVTSGATVLHCDTQSLRAAALAATA